MGCQIQTSDTGIELQVHVFDLEAQAIGYVCVNGYQFVEEKGGIKFYKGSDNKRASLRKRNGYWSVAKWEA